jgi:sporulation protein YlmC with PRC-barrel domain
MGIPPYPEEVPPEIKDYNRHYGEDVYTSDGVKLGTFDQVIYGGDPGERMTYFLVRTGPLAGRFDADALYIPASAVENLGKDRVTLKTTVHAIGEHGWDSPPLGADRL